MTIVRHSLNVLLHSEKHDPSSSIVGGDSSMTSAMTPNELLPPKRKAVVDRLRRRMENYRKHQNECIPRFDYSFNGLVEQNMQDTLLLKKNFLDNKGKKGKKSEKKLEFQNQGRSQPKQETNSTQYPHMSQENKPETKLSVQIVQQLEFTTSSTNPQVSSVTVKTNTSVKSETPLSSPAPSPAAAPPVELIKCKKEPENSEFVDLEQCAAALEKDAAANGSNSFSAFPDLIGDNSGDLITSEAFKDLISEISGFNPEFMKDFDFDKKPIKVEENIQQRFVPGLNFSNVEMSPAAQTLKQMAEQHQHKTQIGLGYQRPPSKPNIDFQFNKNQDLPNSFNSFRQTGSPQYINEVKQEIGQSSSKIFRMSPSETVKPQYKRYEGPDFRQLPRGFMNQQTIPKDLKPNIYMGQERFTTPPQVSRDFPQFARAPQPDYRYQLPVYPQNLQYTQQSLPYRPQVWRFRPQEQFMQQQGVTYINSDTNLSAVQMQHGLPQHQRLVLNQTVPNSSLRIDMEQSGQRNFPPHYQDQPFIGIPPDFNLDFLDLPTSNESSSLNDQDFLNSL